MIRHPFYLGICLLAVVYLGTSNARGWSFWHTLGRPFSSRGGYSGSHGGFNHK
jgi:hypothetical protein